MATRHATVTVTQFTDPMCTWCCGSEPRLRHLRTAYGDEMALRFVVGGLADCVGRRPVLVARPALFGAAGTAVRVAALAVLPLDPWPLESFI